MGICFPCPDNWAPVSLPSLKDVPTPNKTERSNYHICFGGSLKKNLQLIYFLGSYFQEKMWNSGDSCWEKLWLSFSSYIWIQALRCLFILCECVKCCCGGIWLFPYFWAAVDIYAGVAASLADRKKGSQLTELFKNIKGTIQDDDWDQVLNIADY